MDWGGQGVDAHFGACFGSRFKTWVVEALAAPHKHFDHALGMRSLLDAGFSGPVLCRMPPVKLLLLMLERAYRLAGNRTEIAQLVQVWGTSNLKVSLLPNNATR